MRNETVRNDKVRAKSGWLQTSFWAAGRALKNALSRYRMTKRSYRRRRALLGMEPMEARQLMAVAVLDIPTINGDAVVAGATPTDMLLSSFRWNVQRGAASSETATMPLPSEPLDAGDLFFTKGSDSASNDLFVQSNTQPIYATPSKLRVLGDNGAELLKFDLTNSRLTSFGTEGSNQESGSLAFSRIDVTEKLTPTTRTAFWNLLNRTTGTVGAIPNPGNMDLNGTTNLDTVLEIGQGSLLAKLQIEDYSWDARYTDNRTLQARPFVVSRGVDVATTELLEAAVAGSNLGTITISDRKAFTNSAGQTTNRVVSTWVLYNAYVTSFGLSSNASANLTNNLQFGFTKIDVISTDYDQAGTPTSFTTTWDLAPIGITRAALGTVVLNPVEATDAYVDVDSLGSFRYDTMSWRVSNTIDVGTNPNGTNGQNSATLEALTFSLPAGKEMAGLVGSFGIIGTATITDRRVNRTAAIQTTATDTWTINEPFVSRFTVSSEGLEEARVEFDLKGTTIKETNSLETIGGTSTTNSTSRSAEYNLVNNVSTGDNDLGGQSVDTLFEMVVTEAGQTTEIPVQSAQWNVDRDAASSLPDGDKFAVQIPFGLYSPAMFTSIARGNEIDSVSVRRFKATPGGKVELYRWDMTGVFFTDLRAGRSPRDVTSEFDTLSLAPKTIKLVTNRLDANNNDIGDYSMGWNFVTGASFEQVLEPIGDLPTTSTKLQAKFGGNGIAISEYNWGAQLPIAPIASNGARPLGNPDVQPLNLTLSQAPHTGLLEKALTRELLVNGSIALPTLATVPGRSSYEIKLNKAIATAFGYQDAVSMSSATISTALSPNQIFGSNNTPEAALKFTPIDANGTPSTSREINWNLFADTTSLGSGLGGFQFTEGQFPALTLQINDGAQTSQAIATDYKFELTNYIEQLTGTRTSPAPLAPRGTAVPGKFNVTMQLDAMSPGLIDVIASKVKLPEIKIVERRNENVNGVDRFLPIREWTLNEVYVEKQQLAADTQSPLGTITLTLNPGKVTSKRITYDTLGTPTTTSGAFNYVDVPVALGIGTLTGISTGTRTFSLPTRFTDQNQPSTDLNYSFVVLSGPTLFDNVTITASKSLFMDFKNGQQGTARLRVTATDVTGLSVTDEFDVLVDRDGINNAPQGTSGMATTNEDLLLRLTPEHFGFNDTQDLPGNSFLAVKITSLPAQGVLKRSGVNVVAGQVIPISSVSTGSLTYTPTLNANGVFSSFTFQVQDNGGIANGGIDLDPIPKVLSINAIPVNDAPLVLDSGSQSTRINTPLEFSAARGTEVRISDIDFDPSSTTSPSLPMQVQFVTTKGTFRLSTLANLTVTAGTNGSANFTVQGSATAINTALARAIFTPTTNAFRLAEVRLTVNDLANGGLGTALSATKRIPIMIDVSAALNPLGELNSTQNTVTATGSIVAGDRKARLYSFSVPETSNVGLTLSGLSSNVNLQVFTPTATAVGSSANTGKSIESLLLNNLAAGTYYAFVVPTGGIASDFDLAISRVPASDDLIVSPVLIPQLNPTTQPTYFRSNDLSGTVDPQDFYQFNLAAAGPVRINLSGLSSNAAVDLLDQNGFQLIRSNVPSNNIENAFLANLSAGTYFIRVAAPTTELPTQYDLTLSLVATTDDTIFQATSLGTPDFLTKPTLFASGSVDPLGDIQDYYSFDLAAPSDVRLNLSGLSNDASLQLLDAVGRVITVNPQTGTRLENLLATGLAAGRYYVRVGSESAGNAFYNLAVTVNTLSDDLLTGALNLGTLGSATPTANQFGDVRLGDDTQDYFQFTLSAVSDIRINLSGMTSDADVFLEDSDGRVLASSELGSTAIENISMTALAAGTYFIRVKAYVGTTSYFLTASTAVTSDDVLASATALPDLNTSTQPSVRATGVAGGPGDLHDYYKFNLTVPADLRLNLSGMVSNLDLELLDAEGRILTFGNQTGATIERVTKLGLTSGTYYVRVYHLTSTNTTYTLEISTNINGDDTIRSGTQLGTLATTPLTASGSVGGSADIQDYYQFSTTATRNVRVLLTGLSVDVDFQILNAAGRVIATGQSGSTTTEDLTVSLNAGTYFIRIYPFVAANVSNYNLSVS